MNHGVSPKGPAAVDLIVHACLVLTTKSFTGQIYLSLRLYSIVTDITRLMSDGYGWVDVSVESSTQNHNVGKKVVRSIIWMGDGHIKGERIPAKLGGLYSRSCFFFFFLFTKFIAFVLLYIISFSAIYFFPPLDYVDIHCWPFFEVCDVMLECLCLS